MSLFFSLSPFLCSSIFDSIYFSVYLSPRFDHSRVLQPRRPRGRRQCDPHHHRPPDRPLQERQSAHHQRRVPESTQLQGQLPEGRKHQKGKGLSFLHPHRLRDACVTISCCCGNCLISCRKCTLFYVCIQQPPLKQSEPKILFQR